MAVQPDLCQTCSETTLFSHEVAQKSECDSNYIRVAIKPVDAEIAMNGESPETNENNVQKRLMGVQYI